MSKRRNNVSRQHGHFTPHDHRYAELTTRELVGYRVASGRVTSGHLILESERHFYVSFGVGSKSESLTDRENLQKLGAKCIDFNWIPISSHLTLFYLRSWKF